VVLVAVILLVFPLLDLTVKLPKRLIDHPIGAASGQIDFFWDRPCINLFAGPAQLCFLGSFIVHGLPKMRVKTMKSVRAERLGCPVVVQDEKGRGLVNGAQVSEGETS
jgi:hypothetical protein